MGPEMQVDYASNEAFEQNKAKSPNIQANSEIPEATIQVNDSSDKQDYSSTSCFTEK